MELGIRKPGSQSFVALVNRNKLGSLKLFSNCNWVKIGCQESFGRGMLLLNGLAKALEACQSKRYFYFSVEMVLFYVMGYKSGGEYYLGNTTLRNILRVFNIFCIN